jgi:hypothetical protein
MQRLVRTILVLALLAAPMLLSEATVARHAIGRAAVLTVTAPTATAVQAEPPAKLSAWLAAEVALAALTVLALVRHPSPTQPSLQSVRRCRPRGPPTPSP